MVNKELEYLENDIVGENTLDVISNADNFNGWMYNTIKPFCKGNILEIGSGVGNISNCFLKDNFKIQLSDLREGYCKRLESKFGENQNCLGIEAMNLVDDEFDIKYSKYIGQFETVFALNVVEHIQDDTLALQNCYKLLKKGGNLIILVPSYQKLFNQFDTELGHYRRYTKSSLREVFKKAKFRIINEQYFNFIGIFGWFFTGKILNKKTIPAGQMGLYNTLVPIIKIADKIVLKSMGLSTIIVGTKD